jgi:hypothetical protein
MNNYATLLDLAHNRMNELAQEADHAAMVKEAKRSKMNWLNRFSQTAPRSKQEESAEWENAGLNARLRSI